MELFWLSISLIALIMALYMIGVKGIRQGYLYLVFPLLAGAMYSLRRWVRKRVEKQEGP